MIYHCDQLASSSMFIQHLSGQNKILYNSLTKIRLVVWNIFFHILGMSSSQLTNSYFSDGLKPPTRNALLPFQPSIIFHLCNFAAYHFWVLFEFQVFQALGSCTCPGTQDHTISHSITQLQNHYSSR